MENIHNPSSSASDPAPSCSACGTSLEGIQWTEQNIGYGMCLGCLATHDLGGTPALVPEDRKMDDTESTEKDLPWKRLQGNLLETLANNTSYDITAALCAAHAKQVAIELQAWVEGPTFSIDSWLSGVTETYARAIVSDIVSRADTGKSVLID